MVVVDCFEEGGEVFDFFVGVSGELVVLSVEYGGCVDDEGFVGVESWVNFGVDVGFFDGDVVGEIVYGVVGCVDDVDVIVCEDVVCG